MVAKHPRSEAEGGSWNSTIQYTAYGEIRLTEGVTPTKYRYTGQLAQAELGLDYYIARWYDPVTGHFTSADSIIPEPGKASAFDRYGYVSNNPIRYNDLSGNKPCEDDRNGYCRPKKENKSKLPLPPKKNCIKGRDCSDNEKPLFGYGIQQSLEKEFFRWNLLGGDYISGGTTTSNSVNSSGTISFLAETDNGILSGVEFDTENVFGGISNSEGVMIGGRTPPLNELVGIKNDDTSFHTAGSISANHPKNQYETEITATIYYIDVTTSNGVLNGETMYGYYIKSSVAKTAAVGLGVFSMATATYLGAPVLLGGFVSACGTSNACQSLLMK